MLKRLVGIVVLLLLYAGPVFGQNTTITATITDPSGQPYTFASGNASLTSPGNAQEYSGTFPVPRSQVITGVNGNGTFVMTLWDNNLLTPAGSHYIFRICWKDGITCFNTGPITVTGATQNLSAAISAFSVPLPASGGFGTLWSPNVAYPAGAVVSYMGFVYVSLSVGNLNNLPTNATFWQIVSGSGGGCSGGVSGNIVKANSPTTCTDAGIAAVNVSQKPLLFSAPSGTNNARVQYVSKQGNDSNDGRSWGTAKATWDAACESLDGGVIGSPIPYHYCGTGTIYIDDGIAACSNSAYGIQILGTTATSYYPINSTCWENQEGPGQIQTICRGGNTTAFSGAGFSSCTITGGGASDNWHPSFWLPGVDGLEFDGVSVSGQGVNVITGYCPDQTAATSGNGCGTANVTFDGVWTKPNVAAGNGPSWLMGPQGLFIHVFNFSIGGNPSATGGVTADAASAVLFQQGSGGSGDIIFQAGHTQSGNIKVHGGVGTGLVVRDVNNDNDAFGDTTAVVWMVDGAGPVSVDGLSGTSDCGTPTIGGSCLTVRNDTTAPLTVVNSVGGFQGNVNLVGGNPNATTVLSNLNGNVTPSYVRAQSDDAAYEFPPITVPKASLLPTNLNSLSVCGTCSLTTGIVDPSRSGTQAVQISDSGVGDNIAITASSDGGAANGDTFVISLWARPTTAGNCCSAGTAGLASFFLNASGDHCSQSGTQVVNIQPRTLDSAWQHYIFRCDISAYPTPGAPTLYVSVGSSQTMQYAFPQLILLHGYSSTDIAEIALHLGSWNSSLSAGQLGDVIGQVPHVNQAQTWTGTQTSMPLVNPALIEGTAPSGISGSDILYGLTSAHWPAFNPNNSSARALCGSTGTVTSGHIVAFNTSGTNICDLVDGGTGTGSGSVTTFSAGNLSPLFTTSVANPGTTPALTFSLSNFAAHSFYGNNTASSAAPAAALIGTSDTSPNAYAADTGAVNAAVVTLSPAATALTAGLDVRFLPTANNTLTNPTINVNSLGAKTITKNGTAALVAGDLTTTEIAHIIYDGTEFQLQNPATVPATGANTALSNLASVAINAALLPGTTDTIALGSATKRWSDLFLGNGTSYSHFSSSATAARLVTLPDAASATAQALTAGTGVVASAFSATTGAFSTKTITSTAGSNGITIADNGTAITATVANTAGGGNALLACTQTGGTNGQYYGITGGICQNITPGVIPNHNKTCNSYTIAQSDLGTPIFCTDAGAAAVTLSAPSSYTSNFYFCIMAQGAGTVTITASGNINGSGTLAISTHNHACAYNNGTTWDALTATGF